MEPRRAVVALNVERASWPVRELGGQGRQSLVLAGRLPCCDHALARRPSALTIEPIADPAARLLGPQLLDPDAH
jgi:hypothetical protein